jgi:formylglycine-generating enzyme required for sulfatase activity
MSNDNLRRVSRGGSWHHPAWYARVAYCSDNAPSLRRRSLGLRLSRRCV